MPIDSGLIARFQAQQQPINIPDPMENYAKILQLKNAVNQGQMSDMQLQQQRQQVSDAAQMRQVASTSGGDLEKYKQSLISLGKQSDAMAIGRQQVVDQKAALDAQSAKLKNVEALSSLQLPLLLNTRDAISRAKSVDEAQAIWQQTKQQIGKNAASLGFQFDQSKSDDPDIFPGQAWLDNKIAGSTTTDQHIKMMAARNKQEQDDWARKHGDATLSEQIRHGKAMESKPNSAMIMMNQSPSDTDNSAKVYADRLVKGLEPWPGQVSLRTDPVVRAGVQMAREMDHEFNSSTHVQRQKTQQAFTTGKQGDTVNTLNTAMGHLAELSDLEEALGNGNYPSLNAVSNVRKKQTGDPTITQFETVRKAVADEVTKVWRNTGGSEKDVQEALANLNPNLSPKQLRANIYSITKLMESKQNALQEQYHKGMGKFGNLEILDGEAKSGLAKIQERAGVKPTAKSNGSALPKFKSPSDPGFSDLPSGSRFVGPDGAERVKR